MTACWRWRPVAAAFEIDLGVDPGVAGDAERGLGQGAVQQRRGRGRRGERRGGVGIAPGRQRVPGVLHGRRVVQAGAQRHVGLLDLGGGDGAQVEIVPVPGLGDAVVGALHEGAEVSAEAAGEEQAHLVERAVVVGVKPGVGGGFCAFWVLQVRRHHHGRQRHAVVVGAQGVALQLELAPERRQLRTEAADVAVLARLAGLGGEGRHRSGVGRRQSDDGEGERGQGHRSPRDPRGLLARSIA